MMIETKSINLGPGGLLQTGEENPFLLSKAEWLSVQVYVQDGLSLPINNSQLSRLLFCDATSPVSDFQDLLNEFITVYGHCNTWNGQYYPNIVNLSNDIVHYGSKANVYYHSLEQMVDEYTQLLISGKMTPEIREMYKEEMAGVVRLLAQDANKYAVNASKVEEDVTTFLDWCNKDKRSVDQLYVSYDEKYGNNSEEVKAYQEQMKEIRKQIHKLQEKYNKDVIIMATSAAYGWVPIFGWAAAGIVDGLMAKEMKALKEAIKNLQKKLEEDDRIVKRDFHLMNAIGRAKGSLGTISTDLTNVIPVIGKIKGIWQAIHSDLKYIQSVIEEDISGVTPLLKKEGVKLAVQEWQKVGQCADSFRVNAYVQFKRENVA
jgi:hypothetical protein